VRQALSSLFLFYDSLLAKQPASSKVTTGLSNNYPGYGDTMRNSVPFIGEEQISREDSEQTTQKRQSGKVIDEVIACESAESSWDDVVPDSWSGNRSKALRPSPGVRKPVNAQQPLVGKQLVQGSAVKSPVKVPIYKGSATKKTNGLAAFVDWVPINSGHGLRINITGNVDHNLREEWRRLLEDTANTAAKEFEFNLTETPGMSMTGLGMLLLFKERKGSSREAIKLCNCNQDVWQLLNWTGMDKYFLIQKEKNL
jgi:anti-anti-sigma factor